MACRLAVLVFLLASAPRASDSPESLVQKKLLAPLAARDKARSSYSRARQPPEEQRVRILDAAPVADGRGAAFVGFAVDARYGHGKGAWHENEITGCVYVESGQVYVWCGDDYCPARVLLGKSAPEAPGHVCRAAEEVHAAEAAGGSAASSN